jgi:hypothetical protein
MVDFCPDTAETAPPAPPDPVSDDARLLGRMAALGERMANVVLADAEACQQSDALTPGLNKLFDAERSCKGLESIGRFVRRCLALKHRFLHEQTEQGRLAAQRRIEQAEARRVKIRDRHLAIGSALMKAIRADGRGDDAHERLFNDLEDRLELLTDSEVELQSLGGIVKRLCDQLNVPFEPMMFESQDWAVDEIIARPQGSPYADPHWHRPKPIPGGLNNCTLHATARVDSS